MKKSDRKSIHTVAHGKILWLGGYSILERPNVGLVTAVDAGVHAYMKKSQSDVVTVNVPQFGLRARGRVIAKDGTLKINVPEKLCLVKTALQVSLAYTHAMGQRISGFSIKTENDAPIACEIIDKKNTKIAKAGLGSSAAVTVATTGAVLQAFNVDPWKYDALHKLSQLSHSIATGKVGSGFDIAAATYGNIVYTRFDPKIISGFPASFTPKDVKAIVRRKWDYRIQREYLPQTLTFAMASFNRKSAITKSLVSQVLDFKKKSPDDYDRIITQMNKENLNAIDALRKFGAGIEASENLHAFKRAFAKGRYLMKELGVRSKATIEPEAATKLIQKTMQHGAVAATLPGAGGYDAIAALFISDNDMLNRRKLTRVLDFWSANPNLQISHISKHEGGFETRQ